MTTTEISRVIENKPNTVEVRLTEAEAIERGMIRRDTGPGFDVTVVAEGVKVTGMSTKSIFDEWRTIYEVNAADAARFGIRG